MKKQFFCLLAFLIVCPNVSKATPVQWTIGEGGNDHWYEAICVPGGISWTDARDSAPSILPGGYLASITSEEENRFVLSMIGDDKYWSDGERGPWLGGTDEETEGIWQWLSGEPWSYSSWMPGQPDDARGEEDYLHFHKYLGDASTWNDLSNSGTPGLAPSGYIVEVPEPATLLLLGLGGLMMRKRRA